MKKAIVFGFIIIAALFTHSTSQAQAKNVKTLTRPKLVIGIVVDQMRWDYLYRFADRYGTGGFNRLLNKGFSCENSLVPYTPTYTAPGHTCIYTGSVPAIHGIIGNNWYSRLLKKSWYCTADSTVFPVGGSSAGKMSPVNMWTTTVTDELRLATNFQSKVIGIALKDRGAILPAGHAANAAYWFDDSTGNFISSSYYFNALPNWVNNFNSKKLPDTYLQKNWNTLFPLSTYKQSTVDKEDFEVSNSKMTNTFPHITAGIEKNKYNTLRTTPSGNTITIDMAKAAIEGERLGQSAANCDFLAISFSSTDYVGHSFGPNSIEIEDTYLRLDKEFAAFFAYLDKTIGAGQYLLFLTADHAAAHVPAFLKEHNVPAGAAEDSTIENQLNAILKRQFNLEKGVEKVTNFQVYLNREISMNEVENVKQAVIKELLSFPFVSMAVDLQHLSDATLVEPIKKMMTNGYNQKLSGDVQFVYKPHWFDGSNKGTTHGSWNPYDSHIPLLWYGWGIKAGKSNKECYMTDIAPTLSAMLHIQMPSGSVGHVLTEVMK